MKGLVPYYIIFLSLGIIFSSCNNELDLIGEREEKALVYGALNKSEPFMYIRLERLFADENISPVNLARDPNNFYFNDADVRLYTDGWEGSLTRVDATTLGFPRNTGVFGEVPNYIYSIPTDEVRILPGAEYRLEIKAEGKTFSSKTILIDDVEPYFPDFSRPFTIIPNDVARDPDIFFDFPDGAAAPSMISAYLRLNYGERNVSDPTFTDKSIEYPLFENVVITQNQISYSPRDFYRFLDENLQADASLRRVARSFDLKIITGGREYVLYNQSVAANSGITSTADFPIYSNIDNGIGIFTSKNEQVITNIGVSSPTLDSLSRSRYTKDLGFQ